ncbi:MAG: hypothetical protein INR65_20610 [Gluconacetobacter diazotrophicus]|nr:hypothetical protein [Gluconacetobacter diazotrophicus]
MPGLTPDAIESARGYGVTLFLHGQQDRGRTCFEAVLREVPGDPVALVHLSLLREHEAPAEAAELLRGAARADAGYAVRRAMLHYLSRRRRVQEGAPYEDGWLGFLEPVLVSGAWWQPTLDELAALPEGDPDADGTIPRRILQYWDETVPPEEVRVLIERCGRAHPGWVHDVFDDATAQDFLATRYGTGLVDTYRNCFHVTAKSDIFRLAYLHASGGFYVDADEDCHAPLDALRRRGVEQVFCLTRGLPSCVINGFVGTVPGTCIVERALELCLGNIRNAMRSRPRTNVWVMTGPGALTFAILDLVCERGARPDDPFAGFALVEDPEYRRLFTTPAMEYKRHARGNWRLA